MAILVFEHSNSSGSERLGEILRDYGHRLEVVRLHEGDRVPVDLDDVNGIVSCGQLYRIPLLMLISQRGSFGERDPWQCEGGGVTVSAFLEANLLDRLHVAIAPLFIGDGRPAIRLPARHLLRDCLRPRYRVFRMGGDVLFDCDLGDETREASRTADPTVSRVI